MGNRQLLSIIIAPIEQHEQCSGFVVADKGLLAYEIIHEGGDFGDGGGVAVEAKQRLVGGGKHAVEHVARGDAQASAVAFDDDGMEVEDLGFAEAHGIIRVPPSGGRLCRICR